MARALATASWRAGKDPAAQFERMSRAFVRRVVNRAVADPRAIDDRAALLDALSTSTTQDPAHFSAASMALAAGTMLRRVGPLKSVAKRTPLFAVAAATPEIYTSLSRGVQDVGAIASFLTLRATAAGHQADADRIRRATVQLLVGDRLAPDAEPEHDRLVRSWVRRTARGFLPFAKRGDTGRNQRIAAVAAAIDPALLRSPDAPVPAP